MFAKHIFERFSQGADSSRKFGLRFALRGGGYANSMQPFISRGVLELLDGRQTWMPEVQNQTAFAVIFIIELRDWLPTILYWNSNILLK